MILAVSGHRPNKLPGTYSPETKNALYKTACVSLDHLRPRIVYTGMALGWDMAIAAACHTLDIPFIACYTDGQTEKWSAEDQARYDELMQCAMGWRGPQAAGLAGYMERNRFMVEQCETLLVLWNGLEFGGTWQTLQYANQRGVKCTNAWKRFMKEYGG